MSMYMETSSSTSNPDRWIAAATPSIENIDRITSSPFSIRGCSFFFAISPPSSFPRRTFLRSGAPRWRE